MKQVQEESDNLFVQASKRLHSYSVYSALHTLSVNLPFLVTWSNYLAFCYHFLPLSNEKETSINETSPGRV